MCLEQGQQSLTKAPNKSNKPVNTPHDTPCMESMQLARGQNLHASEWQAHVHMHVCRFRLHCCRKSGETPCGHSHSATFPGINDLTV